MDFDPDYKFVKGVLQKAEPTLKNIAFKTLDLLSYLPELPNSTREEVTAQTKERGNPSGIQILLGDLQRRPELFVTFTAALYITNRAAYTEIDTRTRKACCGNERMYRQFVDALNDKLKELGILNDGDSIPGNQHNQQLQQLPRSVANPNLDTTNQIPAAGLPIVQRELPVANPLPSYPTIAACTVSPLEHRANQLPGYQPINYDEMLNYFNIHKERICGLKSHVYASLSKELNKTDPNSDDGLPYWDEILKDPNCNLQITRYDHRNIRLENNPGETLLDLMNDYKHSLADLARVFKQRGMLDALQVLQTQVAPAVGGEPPVTPQTDTSMAYLNENNLNTALERSADSSVSDNESYQNIPAGELAPELPSLPTDPTNINTNIAEPVQESKADKLSSFLQPRPEIDETFALGMAPTTSRSGSTKQGLVMRRSESPTLVEHEDSSQGLVVRRSESPTLVEHEDSDQREESLQDSDQSVDSEKIGNQSSDVANVSGDPSSGDYSKAVPAEQDVTGVHSTPNAEMDCQKLVEDRVHQHDDCTDNLYSFHDIQHNIPATEEQTTDFNQSCGQDGESTAISGLTHEFCSTTPSPALAAEGLNMEPEQS